MGASFLNCADGGPADILAVSPACCARADLCAEEGIAPADLSQVLLAPDIFPFSFHVKLAIAHSIEAIEGIRKELFSPDTSPPDGRSVGSRLADPSRPSYGLSAPAIVAVEYIQ